MEESSNDQSSTNNNENFIDAVTNDEDDDDSEDESEHEQIENSSGANLGDNDEQNLEESFSDEEETDLENDTPSTDDTLTNVKYLVDRTRAYVKLTRRTYILREFFLEEAKRKKLLVQGLILDCAVRWNTVYYILDRFITFQDSINQITVNPRRVLPSIASAMVHRLSTFIFNYNDWNILLL